MRHVALIAFLLVLVAAAAWAVDPPREPPAAAAEEPAFPTEEPAFPEEAPQPSTAPAPAPGGTAAPAPGGTPAPAAAKPEADDEVLPPLPPGERNVGPTKQRFDPSEKVREKFLAEYSNDVVVFRPPVAEPTIVGKEAFGAHYAKNRFNLPALHARLLNRIVSGDTVVDQEEVTGVPGGVINAVAVYKVKDGRIQAVWFF